MKQSLSWCAAKLVALKNRGSRMTIRESLSGTVGNTPFFRFETLSRETQ